MRRGGAAGLLVVTAATSMLVGSAGVASAETIVKGCVIVDNPTPQKHTTCPYHDFRAPVAGAVPGSPDSRRGVDFSGLDLRWADFRVAHLEDSNLTKTNLAGANLYMAILQGSSLASANLDGADLRGEAFLERVDFTGASMKKTRFQASATGTLLMPKDVVITMPENQMVSFKNVPGQNLVDIMKARIEPPANLPEGITFQGCSFWGNPSSFRMQYGAYRFDCTDKGFKDSRISGKVFVEVKQP